MEELRPRFPDVSRRDLLAIATTLVGGVLVGAPKVSASPRDAAPERAVLTQDGAPVTGGTLTLASSSDPGADPQASFYFWVNGAYAETLTSINTRGEIIPFLAERWEVSPDARVYTFDLRDGVTFHNGRVLTAADVKWSLERIKDPATMSVLGAQLANATVEAVDPRTVRITSTVGDAALPAALAMALILAPESVVDGAMGRPIGTGPFVFDSYSAGQELHLKRNDAYWRSKPFLDEVVYKTIVDDTAQVDALRSGSIDVSINLPVIELPLVEADSRLTVQNHAFPSPYHIAFNTKSPQAPLDDVRVRRAIVLALNRQELLEVTVGRGGPGSIDNQPYGSDSTWRLDLLDPFLTQDLGQAQQLLAEAGVPDGFSTTLAAYPGTRLLAEVAQAQLARVGIDVEIDMAPDNPTYLANIQEYDYGFTFDQFFFWYDPAIHYGWYDPLNGSGFFAGGYGNPAFSQLLQEARGTTDIAVRKNLYAQALTLLANEDVAAVDLFVRGSVAVLSDRVHGFQIGVNHLNSAEDGGLKDTWVDA